MANKKLVYIRTFGCQMNEHDSDKIRIMLVRYGYDSTNDPKDADLILYNTCTIREKAYHKAMSEIGRSTTYKKRRTGTLVGVCGCVAEQVREALFAQYPHLDILFGPDQLPTLPRLIAEAEKKGRASALELVDDPSKYCFMTAADQLPVTSHRSPPSVFVSIMKGCNCACSYCIVPSVRGREVCRSPQDIIDEVGLLVSSGAKEVVLLGQNVNAYESNGTSFSKLIRQISDETDISRIRFTSPHPRDVKDDLIREYAENKKLMPHLHLPVQAGGNNTLRKMRRGYTRERYLEICGALYAARPGMSITTDLIVGFCGESNEDFDATLDLMREIRFDSAFAFKYSPRPGTEAAEKFVDDVAEEEKVRRLDLVLKLQKEMTRTKNESFVGRTLEVLILGEDQTRKGFLTGRAADNHIVHFAGHPNQIGNISGVTIKKAHANSLAGEVI